MTFFPLAVRIAELSGTIASPGRIPKLSASSLLEKPPSKTISLTCGKVGDPPAPRKKWGGTEPEITGISCLSRVNSLKRWLLTTRGFQPPISTTRKVPSGLISLTIKPTSSMCAATSTRGAFASSECLTPKRPPRPSTSISST